MEESKKTESTSAPSISTAAQKTGRTQSSKKKKRIVTKGMAHIQATYNNTLVSLSDVQGNVLAWCSAGQVGFKGPKKSTPYAASIIVKTALEKAKQYGLREVDVEVRGIGSGREAAIRALGTHGLLINSITDVTPVPHNGCRRPRPRRV